MVGYIYLNEYENGYMYVGQHVFSQPIIDSEYDGSSSFAKHFGWTPVKKEILEICDTKESLNNAERFWIARYLNLMGVAPCVRHHNPKMAEPYVDGFMLNEQLGGGYSIQSRDSIEKARLSNTGKRRTDEQRKAISDGTIEAMKDPKIRRRISESLKGKMVGEKNNRYGVRLYGEDNPNYGNHILKGVKNPKLSESLKGNQYAKGKHWTLSEETRAKQSAAQKGKVVSEETRKKLSDAAKGSHWKWVDGKRVKVKESK